MQLTDKHIRQLAVFYLLCFLVSYGWDFYHGLLLSQIQPIYFVNRLDITRNIIMLSGLQYKLIGNNGLCLSFDITYLALPLLLTAMIFKNIKGKNIAAFVTACFSLLYAILLSGVCYISPEGAIGWVLVPVIFCSATVTGFYYNFHIVRILFILIIVSAGLWKIRGGGLFNIEEMAGVLLKQHNIYLAGNNEDWFTKFVYWLVQHKAIAYIFYLLAAIAELVFIIGLFTRKYDKLLITAFCLFFIFDLFLMRINYFPWIVFMGCFYFSSFSLPYSPANKYANGFK